MKKLLIILHIALLIVIMSCTSVFAAGDDFTPYRVVCNGVSLDTGYEYHNNLYISLDDFLELGETDALHVDYKKYQIYFDLADLELFIADNETTKFIKENAGTVHVSMRSIGTRDYVPLKILAQIAKLNYEVSGERISLYPQASSAELMRINKKCNAAASLASASGQNYFLAEGQLCSVKQRFTAFSLVEIVGGEKVYVMNDCLSEIGENDKIPNFTYMPKAPAGFDRPFNIAWDNSPKVPPEIASGVDVICPFEWFYLMVGEDGVLGNNANVGYSDTAHDMGYQVWATVTNAFTTSGFKNYTTEVLSNEKLMKKTVAQYLFYAALYKADGINVDYEAMDSKGADKQNFTRFIETFYRYANKMGLCFSVATLVPESWNFTVYDYAALGKACDYITVMSYDERVKVADGPGSASSKGWYTRNINTLLQYVPAEKVLMGVPLYSFINRYDASGKFTACARWSARSVQTCIENAKRDGRVLEGPTWIDADGQYFFSYNDSEGVLVNKLWIEDKRSVLVRIQTALDKGLAGTACWEADYVDAEFYDIFERVYVGGELPEDIINTLEEY